jgi:hypothetical protein
MVCKIIFEESTDISYQQYENEMGRFFDISGKMNFISNSVTINCNTDFLIKDSFALFYLINDFLEFGFSSTTIGENTLFYVEHKEDSIAVVEIEGSKIEVDEKKFLSSILKNIFDFFFFLNNTEENQEYKMYLKIIYSLYMRYIPEKISEISGKINAKTPEELLIEERIKRGKMLGGHILLDAY